MLMPIEIPSTVDQRVIPKLWADQLESVRLRIQAFQDCWERPQIEQFVAADFLHLYQAMEWIRETQELLGNRFLEWGCGFAVVTSIASALEFEAVGMEAESDLVHEANRTLLDLEVKAEVIRGNFLPRGSETLAHAENLPSLGHHVDCGYEQLGLELDDFSLVYSYPWPGEDRFHQAVFDRFASPGALLLCFCGPNDLRLWRKIGSLEQPFEAHRDRRGRRRTKNHNCG